MCRFGRSTGKKVFTNQMWTDGQRTKTNPKTSPEQSAIFQFVQEINKTNANNVTSIENCPDPLAAMFIDPSGPFANSSEIYIKQIYSPRKTLPGSNVIQLTGTIFQLNSRIKETNVLTKFHENWAKKVTSRVFTCFHYIHIEKIAPPTCGHFFSPIWTIFELVREISKTNVLINFHDDWAKIVTSRVFTRKTAPPTGGHVFERTGTIFELNQHIIKTDI
ncbi:hypothetical protein DPMN_126624 [Dreissena polymorpha]|uniref:Uncharacterized protein n=1 Tax=Dreissena polymorpha TaxID=45954 RepID=A0A9D4H0E1_DREPO|nr:hypothetical protein DPMN_126624 [Dreissena polymorpha]